MVSNSDSLKNCVFFSEHLLWLTSVSLEMMLQYGAIPVLFASTANLSGQVQALNRCVSIPITARVPRQFWR